MISYRLPLPSHVSEIGSADASGAIASSKAAKVVLSFIKFALSEVRICIYLCKYRANF